MSVRVNIISFSFHLRVSLVLSVTYIFVFVLRGRAFSTLSDLLDALLKCHSFTDHFDKLPPDIRCYRSKRPIRTLSTGRIKITVPKLYVSRRINPEFLPDVDVREHPKIFENTFEVRDYG